MPVIKIGKVPFNVYPVDKASKVLAACIDVTQDLGENARTDCYLGAFLQGSINKYLEAVTKVIPKLKKLGLTELGISSNLVGYFPALALFGKDELDPLASAVLQKSLTTALGKYANYFDAISTADGIVLASSMIRSNLPGESPEYSGFDGGVGVDTELVKDLVPILGKAYSLFMDDIQDNDLLGSMSKQAAAVHGSTKDPFMKMAARALMLVYDVGSEADEVRISRGALTIRLVDDDDYDDYESTLFDMDDVDMNKHLKIGDALKKYFSANPLSDDLDFVAAYYDNNKGTIKLDFTAEVPSSYQHRDLGL